MKLKFKSSFLFGQPEQVLSKVQEADNYSVSPNNTKPNVGCMCLSYVEGK